MAAIRQYQTASPWNQPSSHTVPVGYGSSRPTTAVTATTTVTTVASRT